MSDLIKREDAIEAVIAEGRNVHTSEYANAERIIYEADAVEALAMLPSAEANPTVIRCKALLNENDFKKIAERIKEENQNVIVIPCDAEVASAEAVQVIGKLKNPCDSLLTDDSDECKEQKSKLDLISREDAIEVLMETIAPPSVTLDTLVMRIDALPSAEAVHGWIPVEEQPPEFPCLVCDANGNHPSVPLGIVTITDEEHGEWHIDGRLWDTKVFVHGEWCSQTGYGNRIIAWMPLPTPYKGGDDE